MKEGGAAEQLDGGKRRRPDMSSAQPADGSAPRKVIPVPNVQPEAGTPAPYLQASAQDMLMVHGMVASPCRGGLVLLLYKQKLCAGETPFAFNCNFYMSLQALRVRRSRSGAGTLTASSWRRGSQAAAAASTSSARRGHAWRRRKPTGDQLPWTAG